MFLCNRVPLCRTLSQKPRATSRVYEWDYIKTPPTGTQTVFILLGVADFIIDSISGLSVLQKLSGFHPFMKQNDISLSR